MSDMEQASQETVELTPFDRLVLHQQITLLVPACEILKRTLGDQRYDIPLRQVRDVIRPLARAVSLLEIATGVDADKVKTLTPEARPERDGS